MGRNKYTEEMKKDAEVNKEIAWQDSMLVSKSKPWTKDEVVAAQNKHIRDLNAQFNKLKKRHNTLLSDLATFEKTYLSTQYELNALGKIFKEMKEIYAQATGSDAVKYGFLERVEELEKQKKICFKSITEIRENHNTKTRKDGNKSTLAH